MKATYGAHIEAFSDDDELHTVELVRRNKDGSENVLIRAAINSRLGGWIRPSGAPMAMIGHEFFLRGIEGIDARRIVFNVETLPDTP